MSQRARLIEAAIEVVGTKGYAASTIGDIIRAARVSRSTFYEQFSDKEECFIAAYEQSARAHLGLVLDAAKHAVGAIQRVQGGVRAYLEVLGNEPAYAHASLVEVLAAGPSAAATRDFIHLRYSASLRKWHSDVRAEHQLVPPIPDEVFDCAVGGVGDFLASMVRSGHAERLPSLAPVIVTFLLNATAVPAGRQLSAALSASRTRRSG